MKTSFKFGIASAVAGTLIILVLGVNFGNRIDDVNQRVNSAVSGIDSQVSAINSQIENVVSFLSTTTTSTTSTTTTTTTTLPPPKAAPSKSSLVRKVDEYAPGSSDKYGAAAIEEGGKMACRMWNAEAGISRFAVVREVGKVMRLESNELTVAAAITQAVLWTICPVTATFPEGPLPFDNWR